jgi:hypothetical protein
MKLHRNHAGVQKNGCNALWGLAVNGELNILFVVFSLHSPFFFPTVSSFFWLIFLFVLDDNKVAIASKGGIELILQAMKLHRNHAGVQESGCGALWGLAVNGELNILFVVFLSILLYLSNW